MKLLKWAAVSFICFLSISLNLVEAKCTLPVPDNGAIGHSPPNLEGKIVAISEDKLKIKAVDSGAYYVVRVGKGMVIYTAFGGDGEVSQLKAGLHVWVWYRDCRSIGKASIANAAYFQVYSFDGNDRPNSMDKQAPRGPK